MMALGCSAANAIPETNDAMLFCSSNEMNMNMLKPRVLPEQVL